MPSSGTLNPSGPQLNWAGTAVGGGSVDESTCVEGVNCDTFVITLSSAPSNWTGFKARIVISAADPSGLTDYDLYAQSYDPAAQQFYVGMRTDQNGAITFDYGTIATQVVGLVIGVPTETSVGALPGSGFNADGTITLVIPKSAVGSPASGDLLGAINGRTFTGDTPETQNLERSTLLVDHTFVKGQRDNGHPAATYTVVGNVSCGP